MAADLHNITSPVAKATAAAPSLTEGDVAGLSQDLSGRLRTAGVTTLDQSTPGTTNAVAIASAAGTLVASTITTGGTAQNAFSATPTNGWEIINPHATETLYAREGGTATVADNGSNIPIAPKASYYTPATYKPTGDVSVIAATTGHAFIARRW
jgi:hypothetical protein